MPREAGADLQLIGPIQPWTERWVCLATVPVQEPSGFGFVLGFSWRIALVQLHGAINCEGLNKELGNAAGWCKAVII